MVAGELSAQGAQLRGVDAVSGMLGWNRGAFAFQARPVNVDDEVQLPLQHLLMEAARLSDEMARDE